MRFIITIAVFQFCLSWVSGQNLHISPFAGFNRTAYEFENYQSNQSFYTYGARLAFGHENFQIGGEYETNLTEPSFVISDNNNVPFRRDEFSNTFIGTFIRWNTSEVPAYRLGLVLTVGAGFHETDFNSFSIPDDRILEATTFSDKYLGFNASLGFSGPIHELLHWELHYQFDYANIPELQSLVTPFPEFRAMNHSIQLGVSMNFVFGEAAKRSKRIINSSI